MDLSVIGATGLVRFRIESDAARGARRVGEPLKHAIQTTKVSRLVWQLVAVSFD